MTDVVCFMSIEQKIPAILGMALLILGKSWFLDRMVWLHDEMKNTHSEYEKWFLRALLDLAFGPHITEFSILGLKIILRKYCQRGVNKFCNL